MRVFGVAADPVGMIVSSLLLFGDIADSAYTVMIPSVIYIVALRRIRESDNMFGGIFDGRMDDDDAAEDDEGSSKKDKENCS